MLCSNMLFGQGPWTPWQMFAMGLIGFLGGVCFHNGPLRQSRLSLAIFGAVCSVLVYGGIMNPSTALIWARTLDWKVLLSYYLTGIPWDLCAARRRRCFCGSARNRCWKSWNESRSNTV